jgi:hypothetical protein
MNKPPTVGQIIFSRTINNAMPRNGEPILSKITVTIVGHKFFHCSNGLKYDIEDWAECSKYSPISKLYETKEQFEYDRKLEIATSTLFNVGYNLFNSKKIPNDIILKLYDILPENIKKDFK